MSERKSFGIKYSVFRIAAGILMYLCFAGAIFYGSGGVSQRDIRLLTGTIQFSAKEAESLQQQAYVAESEITPFTIWKETKEAVVEYPELNRQAEANLITVSGSSDLVLSGSSVIGGEGDTIKNSCLLDEELCLRLFGSTQVKGGQLRINGRLYSVAGILYHAKNTILIEADSREDIILDKISVEIPKGRLASEELRRLANQLGFPETAVSLQTFQKPAGIGALLLPVILLCSLLHFTVSRLPKERTVCRWAGLILIAFLGAGFLWITGLRPSIPKEWIPTRWSDFEFFSDLWEQKCQEIGLLLSSEKTQPELIILNKSLKALAFGVGAALLYFLSPIRKKDMKITETFGWSTAYVCMCFLAVLYGRAYDISASGIRMLWILLPVYLAVRYFLNGMLPAKPETVYGRQSQ